MSNQYRSILKATSIFGGTQIIQILVTIIKAKFVAILIGATGMGLISLYVSSITIIITIFGLGLNSSVVKDLSKAFDENDVERFSIITLVFKKILYLLSILGVLCVICISPLLSKWAFGNSSYTSSYCLLSLMVGFTLLMQGNTAIIISARKIKHAALCTLIGAIINLFTSIPLFYYLGTNGIALGLVLSALGNYIVTQIFVNKIRLEKVAIYKYHFIKYGKSLISLGIAMIIAVLIGNLSTYIINLSITRMGGLKDLGYYNAGINITTQALAMIFAAMSSDYYPRLVASLSDNERMNNTINQESEIILYLSIPILSVFLLLSPLIITILLSNEFQIIKTFIRILCIGMFFKVISFPLGNVSFAKGDKLVYIMFEAIWGNLLNICLSLYFYHYFGLYGLAYSFLVTSIIYFILVSILCIKRYKYIFKTDIYKIYSYSLSILLILITLVSFNNNVTFGIGGFMCLGIISYSLYILNKKTEFIRYFIKR